MKLSGQYPSLPYRVIITGGQFRTAESIFITKEGGAEPLVYPQKISTISIGQEIT